MIPPMGVETSSGGKVISGPKNGIRRLSFGASGDSLTL